MLRFSRAPVENHLSIEELQIYLSVHIFSEALPRAVNFHTNCDIRHVLADRSERSRNASAIARSFCLPLMAVTAGTSRKPRGAEHPGRA